RQPGGHAERTEQDDEARPDLLAEADVVDEEEAVDRIRATRQRRYLERVPRVRPDPTLEGEDLVVGARRARRDPRRERPHASGRARRQLRVPDEGAVVELR